MIHTQEKKKLIEMDSEWAQNVSLANKILKTYYKYIQKKENKMLALIAMDAEGESEKVFLEEENLDLRLR